MNDLEKLVKKYYGQKNLPPECREAVLEYLNDSLNDSRRREQHNFAFIKELTKAAKTMFVQDHRIFSYPALMKLVELHEEGIAIADAFLKNKKIISGEAVTEISPNSLLGDEEKYFLHSFLHLKSHLADILNSMGFHGLYPDDNSWRQGMEKANNLAYSTGRQTWRYDPLFSYCALQTAEHSAFPLYERTKDLSFAEKAYFSLAGMCIVIERNASKIRETDYPRLLKRKAFVAHRVFRNLRADRQSPAEPLLQWGGRAYHSIRRHLLEGQLLPIERANSLYDLGAITSLLAKVDSLPRLAQRAFWHYEDFLAYAERNDLNYKLAQLVTIAQETTCPVGEESFE